METSSLSLPAKLPKKWIVILGGTLLFNFLFWKEGLGINMIAFILFMIASLHFTRPAAKVYPLQWIVFAGIFLGSASLIYYHSFAAILLLVISLLLYCIVTGNHEYRTVVFPLADAFLEIMASTSKILRSTANSAIPSKYIQQTGKWLKILLFPIVIVFVFLLIYLMGSPVFLDLFSEFWSTLTKYISFIFNDYPPARFILITMSLLVLIGLFIESTENRGWKEESGFMENLLRPGRKKHRSSFSGILDLKYQNTRGIIAFILLCILLAQVVIVDIHTFIFGVEEYLFYKAVHSGVYVLVFSIFISIILVLYFFHGKLNFYSGNKNLRYAAASWLAMNMVLVLSTAWKNYIYIEAYGLTHKRIGVFLFLIFLSVMLWLVHVKVMQRKSLFYLLKNGSLAIYLMLVSYNLAGWDPVIARYNLSRSSVLQPDISYLMSLSDNVIPVLVEYQHMLDRRVHFSEKQSEITHRTALERKMVNRGKRRLNYTGLSWTYADQKIDISIKNYYLNLHKSNK